MPKEVEAKVKKLRMEPTVKEPKSWSTLAGASVEEAPTVKEEEPGWINLAKVKAGLHVLRLMNWKVAWATAEGMKVNPADASTIKVFGTEFFLDAFRLLMEVMGQRGYLTRDTAHAISGGMIETLYRSLLILTFGGGTNEIQRDLIGLFGLGLPRIPRM